MLELCPAVLGELVRSLGENGFPRLLLEALHKAAGVEHLAIVAFDGALAGHGVGAESMGKSPVAKAAGRVYETSLLYRYDPSTRIIANHMDLHDQPLIFRLRRAEIENEIYRKEIYEAFDLIDRITLVDNFMGRWHATSFYRSSRTGSFSDDELAVIEVNAKTITALVSKHFAIRPGLPERSGRHPPMPWLEGAVRRLDSGLTARQIQVCARALIGMTNPAIGLDLGIQAPTVATLRKRAYGILNISSLNELFALCLAQSMSQRDHGFGGTA